MKLFALSLLLSVAAALPAKSSSATKSSAIPKSTGIVPGKSFDQWGFLIMENTDYDTSEGNAVFKQIQAMGNNRLLSNYLAITHPSEPNYLATLAADYFGIDTDGSVAQNQQSAPCILDLLEAKGISWKMYAEDYPGDCFLGATNDAAHEYASKHVPALYFTQITSNASRCANVVPGTQFAADLEAGTLPQWWYYVPTLDNDGHDTSTPYVANYLTKTWLPRFQNETFMQGLAMLLTYDENETETEANHVYAALIGGAVNPKDESKVDATAYDHYSITKTVEENWALGSLGKNDVNATPIEI